MGDRLDSPHERLEWARRKAGYEDKADFARAIGVKPVTYRSYETGQNGFAKLAPVIARRLGVTAEWLLEGGQLPEPGPKTSESDHPPIRNAAATDGAIAVRSVDLSYAMGDGTDLEDYPEEEPVLFDPGFLRRVTRAPVDRLFVAKGDGDSMFPTLINDDDVLIDTTQRILNQQDRIWACAFRGAGMIKRLRIVGDGEVEIKSDNKTVGDQVVPAEDLHIVGRVVWVGRRV